MTTTSKDRDQMRPEQVEDLVQEYMKVWTAGEEDRLDHYAHESIMVHYSHFEQPYEGIPSYKEMLKMTHAYFPDMVIGLDKVIPGNDLSSATVLWSYRGTHQEGELFGVEATGKTVFVEGMTYLEFQDGLAKWETGIVDNLNLAMQLGVMG